MEKILDFIRAGYSHFYIHTHELNRAERMLKDLIDSLTKADGSKPLTFAVWSVALSPDVKSVMQIIDQANPGTVFLLKNFNWVINDRNILGKYAYDIIQAIQDRLIKYRSKEQRKIMVIVSSTPVSEGLPKELQNEFLPLSLDRPNKIELEESYNLILESAKEADSSIKTPKKDVVEKIIDAARGMTAIEAENAFAYSFVKSTDIKTHAGTVSDIKSKVLENVAGIEYAKFTETFEELIGLDKQKEFFLDTIHSPLSKGILSVGPPGCGKTMFGKACGNASGLPVLVVEFANIFGSLLGETYERMGNLISIIKAMGKCIVFIDEIEKGMSGVGAHDSGGTTGNEVTKRAMGMWLKFMSDPREAYIIATCNNIWAFAGAEEYLRAERWDCAPFFIDLPNEIEKKVILDHYKKVYDVKGNPGMMIDWSGAEIKAVCRIAVMKKTTLADASQYIIPIGKIMGKEKLESFRKWAETNTIPASSPMYEKVAHGKRQIDI